MTGPSPSTMREIAPSHEPAHGRHRVVVVGAGFGGLETVQRLAGSGVVQMRDEWSALIVPAVNLKGLAMRAKSPNYASTVGWRGLVRE